MAMPPVHQEDEDDASGSLAALRAVRTHSGVRRQVRH